jgi:phage replication-related protein YjqB (UPF0714/DUF867 family)
MDTVGDAIRSAEDPFAALLAHPGLEEQVELGSRFGFMAFHGGQLEERTDVVASLAATLAGASYYGILTPADAPHLPSTAFRPSSSPALARFLDHVEVVVTVHGYGREGLWTTLLAGGSNRDLAAHVATHLRDALPDYDVLDDLDAIPDGLRGLHPDNPVNVPPGGGVQLELPPRVRGTSPLSPPPDRDGLSAPTRALAVALAKAAATWPLSQ